MYYESLDLDDVENDVLSEERQRRGGHMEPKVWKRWLVLCVIGILTGITAFGIDKGIKGLIKVKLDATTHFMHTEGTIGFWSPYLVYTGINLAYVSVAAALVVFVENSAKGSGIGEIKSYLNGVRLFRIIRLKTLVCKTVGILFSVASGLPAGKEGPMIHSGAAIANGIATGKTSKLHIDTGFLREFRSDREKRRFVTAGAAAGVGAAFGAPIGGVLFAVEEVGSFWNVKLTVNVFVCAAFSAWTLTKLQHPEQFEKGGQVKGLINFGEVGGSYKFSDVPFVIVLGVLGGLLGALFINLNLKLAHLRRRFVNTKLRRFVEALVVSAIVSTTMMILVTRAYQCDDADFTDENPVSQKLLEHSKKSFGCPDGKYNDMATYYMQSMEHATSLLIHRRHNVHWQTLFTQFSCFYALTILTYGVYVPSGLFVPSLSLGASFGHLYAQVINHIVGVSDFLSPSHFSLFGGLAMLGGTTRMTISIIVILMEATANTSFFYPFVIITVFAKLAGDYFGEGIYDTYLHLNHVPLIENDLEETGLTTKVAGEVANGSMVTVHPQMRVIDVMDKLKRYPFHNALVVVDPESHKLCGLLLRRTAIVLIDRRAWEAPLCWDDFIKSARERELLKLKKYKIFDKVSEADYDKTLDLSRYMDRWPYQFNHNVPVPRVRRTFRELGLRHIVIVDDENRPIGLVARKQLLGHQSPSSPRGYDEEAASERLKLLVNSSSDGELSHMLEASEGSLLGGREWSDAYTKHVN